MNIQTVASNLRATIAGKEKLLGELKQRMGIKRETVDQFAFVSVVNFLEVNIDELKRILQDVEQCEQFNNYEKWDGDE